MPLHGFEGRSSPGDVVIMGGTKTPVIGIGITAVGTFIGAGGLGDIIAAV